MAEIATGTLVDGRYKIVSRLGSGGMADVYLAEDQQLGRKVALKLLHRRFAEDPDFVERFRREAQAAAGLQHPNVVSVYDRGSYDGTYYIAMEYLPGRTLKQVIRQDAPIDPIRAIDITIQILKAARFAHRRGVIHRDLKPHNVIVDESDHAKVTDFGIARAGASDMTETGSIMGTAQYLSPEQAQGHAVSEASDLYSVGVVLYELVTGRVPFDAEAAVTIALKHVSEAPVPPTSVSPSVPIELEQVILWALNKDPAHRPNDADQLIQALEQARAAILAGSLGQRTADMAALPIAAVGLLDAPAAAAYAAGDVPPAQPPLAAGAVPAAPVDDDLPPEDDTRRPRPWWPWLLLLALLLAGGAAAAILLTRPAKVLVPVVVNQQVAVAQTEVQNAGLTPNLIYRTTDKPQGTVIDQNPRGGVRVDDGSTVTLTVSNGPGNTVVPTVEGRLEAQAVQVLKAAHLVIGATLTENSDTIPTGSATRTDPVAGQSLPVGTNVTLFVSSGQAKVKLPDVVGQTQAQATSTLQNHNFTVNTSTQESTTVSPGNVISQNPAGNSQVDPNSAVTLVIAKAPATTTIPNVVGSTAASATSTLTSAGFKVTTTSQSVTKHNQDGVVLSQSPAAGKQGKKGSTVTIVVGRLQTTTTTSTSRSTSTSTTTSTSTSTKTTP
jgi:beta-lactam-binding protein with PASTA domain